MSGKQEAPGCIECDVQDTPLWVRMDQVRRGQPVPWRCLDCYLRWLDEHPPRDEAQRMRA
jgi:hypothetical protein